MTDDYIHIEVYGIVSFAMEARILVNDVIGSGSSSEKALNVS